MNDHLVDDTRKHEFIVSLETKKTAGIISRPTVKEMAMINLITALLVLICLNFNGNLIAIYFSTAMPVINHGLQTEKNGLKYITVRQNSTFMLCVSKTNQVE